MSNQHLNVVDMDRGEHSETFYLHKRDPEITKTENRTLRFTSSRTALEMYHLYRGNFSIL